MSAFPASFSFIDIVLSDFPLQSAQNHAMFIQSRSTINEAVLSRGDVVSDWECNICY